MERALINGKDVTTDWMESIFDSSDVIRYRNKMVGFIHHCPLIAYWGDNTVVWEVMPIESEDHLSAYILLEDRLNKYENGDGDIYSTIEHGELGRFQIIQHFYFKED